MTGAIQLLLASKLSSGSSLSASKNGDADATGESPPSTQTLVTNTVTITPAGGAGPYTYAWAFVSGNNVFTPSNTNTASVNWTATVSLTGKAAVWRCTVGDGVNTVTVDVNVTAVVL